MPQVLSYKISGCCSPVRGDVIVGYLKDSGEISVHKADCQHLEKLQPERILQITWEELPNDNDKEEKFDEDFYQLDDVDYQILKHHQQMGIDYSIAVARDMGITTEECFEHHRKLKQSGFLKRVEKVMIQYRKNIVKYKWVKHRNHTYYELTEKGSRFLAFYTNVKRDA
jgi:hypothetical protein